jgi:hypothetical protein
LKVVVTIFSVLLLLAGTWWVLQGTGIAPIGFMANHIEYAYLGAAVDIIAIVALVLVYRRRTK